MNIFGYENAGMRIVGACLEEARIGTAVNERESFTVLSTACKLCVEKK